MIQKSKLLFEDGIYRDNRDIRDDVTDERLQLEDTSFWHKHRGLCILEAVKRWYTGVSFVDVGAGCGYNAEVLTKAGYEVTVFEPRINRAEVCKTRGIKNIVCASFSRDTVNTASVPAVGLFDVLEHIEDDADFLTEVRDLVSDNGLLFITAPAYKWLWSKKDIYENHCRRYTLKRLKVLAEESGYTVLYSTYFYSLFTIPLFCMRSIPYRISRFFSKKTAKQETSDVMVEEHKNKFFRTRVAKFSKFEQQRIRKGKKIPSGASCLIVLKKPVCEVLLTNFSFD